MTARHAFMIGLASLLLTASACSKKGSSVATSQDRAGSAAALDACAPPICGADRTDQYVPYLQGKRVALVVNQTSTIGGDPSLEALLAKGVKVVKVFGPEHGFRGNASAGTVVGDEVDAKTGVPVISLYGNKRKPSKEDMADVDVMIFDMQDVGTRFYTNINVMRNIMDVCAEQDKELIILDRPNPNAYLVDGPVLDMKHKSGVGQFPIPVAYGMTVGEFAHMLNGEGWLTDPKAKCRIKVIPVANYTHDTPYVVPIYPSPNLNTQQAIMLYPSTCLFEGTILNHGRGTMMPFTVLGAPALKDKYTFSYTPVGIPGVAESVVHQNEVCYGLDLRTYDVERLRKSRKINIAWMIELYNAYPDKARFFDNTYHRQIGRMETRIGVGEFTKQLASGMSEEEIRKTWEPGLSEFKAKRLKYLIYP